MQKKMAGRGSPAIGLIGGQSGLIRDVLLGGQLRHGRHHTRGVDRNRGSLSRISKRGIVPPGGESESGCDYNGQSNAHWSSLFPDQDRDLPREPVALGHCQSRGLRRRAL
jgi:hypothetical protein